MNYFSLEKNFLIYYILYLIINKVFLDDCVTHSFPDLSFPKSITLSNGYHIMVSSEGIFSFTPLLSKIVYSYNFTEDQKFSVEIHYMKNTINQVEISQFSNEEGGKKYVLVYANHYIYFLSEYGQLKFYKKLEEEMEAEYSLTLIAYKYDNGIYYFIIGYNINESNYQKYSSFFYYKISNENEIDLHLNNNIFFSDNLSPAGISCQAMFDIDLQKKLICFVNAKSSNLFLNVAFALAPDENFNFKTMSNSILETNYAEVKYIKSSINNDRKFSLICYSIESPSCVKCLYYDSIQNILSDIILTNTYCNPKSFGFNTYYFEKANEYIISCIDNSKFGFTMKRINYDFSLINDEDNTFEDKSFTNCYTLDFFSVIYISKYQQYSAMFNSNCNGGQRLRIFMLSNSVCINPPEDEKEEEQNIATTIIPSAPEIIITTIPKIITTLPIIETTFISTIPEIIITTIPKIITTLPIIETTFISTIPEIIITTIPNIISTFPIIETTINSIIPNIISSLPKIETTNIENNIITINSEITIPITDTTILNIQSSIYDISTLISTIPIETAQNDYATEILCDNTKTYIKGKCICDINKGYYSVYYNSSDNKCYRESELPKNLYFNKITQTYELCYKTCGTCSEGGTLSNNNCLTCITNFIKEPRNNSSNCVENCKFLYYYDSMNQFSCTEDEQCPNDASLIVRNKDKCVNKCSNDDTNIYQYNGECLSSCPINTKANNYNICQINDINNCSISDFILNLDETINQENVKLAAKNYAKEFYYTVNHISRFLSQNFTMVLYKNSTCIDALNLNITKIEYDSCIQQLKKDNNINENKELIIGVIDIKSGNNPITSFGFFNPDNGGKLDASKSCSDKNVIMYENIFNILNDSSALSLLQNQKINIFDLKNEFYTDICFHFDSPNGKDATLQDRIKAFYPNVTLCDEGCKNKGINITAMKAECVCSFQDLLNNNNFINNIIGDNVLIKDALKEVMEMISNLNIEILACYKDVFTFKYFKKNLGGFIILILIFFQLISFIYFYLFSYQKLIRDIYFLTEQYILSKSNSNIISKNIINPPKKQEVKYKLKYQNISENGNIERTTNSKSISNLKDSEDKFYSNKNISYNNDYNNEISKNENENKVEDNKIEYRKSKRYIKIRRRKKRKNKNLKLKDSEEHILDSNQNPSELKQNEKEKKKHKKKRRKKRKLFKRQKSSKKSNYLLNQKYIDIQKFIESSCEEMDYDDAIEEDKRTYCQYFCQKIKINQMLINSFFISEISKPRSIKIAVFFLTIDLYFLINGLFFSDSYISEVFNLTEKETFFSFIPRSIERFIYSTFVGNIANLIIKMFFIEEIKIKKNILKKRENFLILRYEMSAILKMIIKKIKILSFINFIISIFSWYYISCLNNVYPNIRNEWIISSLFLIIIMQILPFIYLFLEVSIRFISIKCESEKLFKLSLLFS